jgi:ligand-binding sensor domain-containing protein
MKGDLNVDSYPQGASIIVNDSATGKVTPFIFSQVLPDTYNVVLQKTGYWGWHYKTVVKTDRTTRVYGSLEDTSIFVNYRMSNSDIPTNYINGVVIDQNGNKWIADSYNLTKFDDQNWVIYNPGNSSYPGGNVNSISAFGTEIWVCTTEGLIKYTNGNFEILGTQSGLPSNYIYCGLKVNESIMWVGTNLGLCYFNGTNWIVYDINNSGLPVNNVSSIKIDDNNNKWIGTAGGGVVKFNDTTWTVYNSENSNLPLSNKVTDIEIINGSSVWVSFNSMGKSAPGGTAMFDGTHWTSFPSIPSTDVSGIAVQTENLIWFGNFDNGLTKYENGAWHTYLTSNSHISSNRIFGVAIDQNNYKWIATYGGGLSKYKGN